MINPRPCGAVSPSAFGCLSVAGGAAVEAESARESNVCQREGLKCGGPKAFPASPAVVRGVKSWEVGTDKKDQQGVRSVIQALQTRMHYRASNRPCSRWHAKHKLKGASRGGTVNRGIDARHHALAHGRYYRAAADSGVTAGESTGILEASSPSAFGVALLSDARQKPAWGLLMSQSGEGSNAISCRCNGLQTSLLSDADRHERAVGAGPATESAWGRSYLARSRRNGIPSSRHLNPTGV